MKKQIILSLILTGGFCLGGFLTSSSGQVPTGKEFTNFFDSQKRNKSSSNSTEKELFDILHIKIFIDTIPELRFKRRLDRDNKTRNRNNMYYQHHVDYYINYVIPSFNKYILPLKYKADLIVNGHGNNLKVLYDLLLSYINK